ncbi:MAG: hypothetical protein M1816_001777 [Peltula sp. TS41687]|nr:MAG: hypothetical protein M1816_001777 [Peltula sp. TS41687]
MRWSWILSLFPILWITGTSTRSIEFPAAESGWNVRTPRVNEEPGEADEVITDIREFRQRECRICMTLCVNFWSRIVPVLDCPITCTKEWKDSLMKHYADKISPDLFRVAMLMECTAEDVRGLGEFGHEMKVRSTIEKALSSMGKSLHPLLVGSRASSSTGFLGGPPSMRIAVP